MLILQLVIYGYSLLALLFLLLDSKTNRELYSKTAYWFRIIIFVTMLVLVLEAITFAVDQKAGVAMYWAGYLSNSLLFMLNLAPLSLWLVYLDECILTSDSEKKKKRTIYIAFNLAVVLIVIVNFFSGILFTISSDNRYERGEAVVWIMSLNMVLFFGYLLTLLKYRKFISGRIYELILTLGILPILGATIQILFYGTPLVWPMMALVALAAHILVEKEEIRRDCLTGLLSRTQLEARVRYIMDHHQPFSFIMLDIDRFKNINDTYGHNEGDQALCVIANQLAKSIKQVDSAYRYAGDEFILIIESEDPDAARKVIKRLETNLQKYNKSKQKPYSLSFSAGTAYYDGKLDAGIVDLFTKADERMYQNKKIRYGQESEKAD
ncbi:MAG: GGDEF domain-containing protein [Eubacteriales bacterium]|nr:GGDEF domain-containing protein [Eubacteriales bacterium]